MKTDQPAPILLVDSDRQARTTLRVALEGHGYPVLEALDGPDALQIIGTTAMVTRPCLMVLDMADSVMSVWEFLAIVNYVTEALIPVVLISAEAPHWETMVRGVVACHIGKPYDIDQIVSLVQSYARQHCKGVATTRA